MLLIEVPAYLKLGTEAVIEWQQNQTIVSRVRSKPTQSSVGPGLVLHFLHGALAGVVFGLTLMLIPTTLPPYLLSTVFGLVLSLVGLGIQKPITHSPLWVNRESSVPILITLLAHLMYGITLGILAMSL